MGYRQRSNWKRSHKDAVMREFGGPQSPHNFFGAWTDHHIHGANLAYRLQWHFHWNPWNRKSGNMTHSIFSFPSNSALEAYWTHHAQRHVIVVDGSTCSDDSHIAHFGIGSRDNSGKVSFNIIFICIGILYVLVNIKPRPNGGGGRCPPDSFLGYKLHATSYIFGERGLIFA